MVRDGLMAVALPDGAARALALEREVGEHRRSAGRGEVARTHGGEREEAHDRRGARTPTVIFIGSTKTKTNKRVILCG